jgi:hypothetical protein
MVVTGAWAAKLFHSQLLTVWTMSFLLQHVMMEIPIVTEIISATSVHSAF